MKERSVIRHIVMKNRGRIASTVTTLLEVQAIRGYLSENELRAIADETGTSIVDIYGIVSSNPQFRIGHSATDPPYGGATREGTQLDVRCHHCNHSLIDTRWLIDGYPSTKVTVSFAFDHGWFRFSSLSDRRVFVSEHELPQKGEAAFFCPHCNALLFSPATCQDCGAPLVPTVSRTSRLFPVCSSPAEACIRAPINRHLDDVPHRRTSDRTESTAERSLPAENSERRIP